MADVPSTSRKAYKSGLQVNIADGHGGDENDDDAQNIEKMVQVAVWSKQKQAATRDAPSDLLRPINENPYRQVCVPSSW